MGSAAKATETLMLRFDESITRLMTADQSEGRQRERAAVCRVSPVAH
ncbi:hypothetical protein ACIOTI_43160 [Streptomyces sp. NPDC087843]